MPMTDKLPWYLESPGYANYELAALYTLDLETTNIAKGDPREVSNEIVLGSFKHDFRSVRTFSGSSLDTELSGIASAPSVLVAHNAKFELGWLLREGVALDKLLVWDTMVAEYVIAGNRKVPLDLDSVGQRYGLGGKDPLVDALISGGVCPSTIPQAWLQARCERDVETTYGVYLAQRAYFNDHPRLAEVFFTRCIVTPVLAAIESEGMVLDPERVYAEYERVVRARRNAEAELKGCVGDLNFRSPKQMAALLYDKLGFEELTDARGNVKRTAAGGRMTDGDTLAALKATTPEQKKFVQLRQDFSTLDALLTKNLAFFEGVCQKFKGKFYGNFNQCVTQTHRLSSSGKKILLRGADGKDKAKGVQFQNMPRDYKKLFKSREADWQMVEIDGAQLEFRVAGQLGLDKQVCGDVIAEADIHRFTASQLRNKPESAVSKQERTDAKPDTFKPLYGGMSGTKAQKRYYEAFRRKYKATFDTQMSWVHTVLREKKLETATGLVFYWPDTRQESDSYIRNTASIFNYPIQSFATADIIPISLVFLFWTIKARGIRARIVNTVHDSAPTECHKEDIGKLQEAAKECFLDRTYEYLEKVYNIEMLVPLGIGFTAGSHWGEGDEQKFSHPYKRTLLDGG